MTLEDKMKKGKDIQCFARRIILYYVIEFLGNQHIIHKSYFESVYSQIKSNHTEGVFQQLPFVTWETTSRSPNTNGVFSLTNIIPVGRRKSRTHNQI